LGSALKRILLACSLGVFTAAAQVQASDSATVEFNSAAQFSVPEIGGGVGLLDQQKERAIGEKVFREVNKQMPVMQNPWLEDRLYSVFSNILSQTQLNQPVGLLIINDPQINAFAVPGGLFALNAGLINSARNMDEMAGVMAHEIAHVTQRHYSRSQEAFKGQGLLSLAGILVGALVASKADGDAGAAVMLGSQAALLDKQLTYSRNQEREADRIGMQYMYTSGYNPQSMADFFEVMNRETSRVSFLPDFWLTHPLTSQRMSEARLRANQLPKVKPNLNNEDFEVLRQYSRVLSGQSSEQQLQALAGRNNFAGLLALAAWQIQHGDFVAAQSAIDKAKTVKSSHVLMTLLQTDIYLGQNKISDALALISSAATIMPENRALNYKYAEALIRNKQSARAEMIVRQFLNSNPRDVSGWRLMQQSANADSASALRSVNVLRYRAEVEFWSGSEENAIKSLLHAKRLAKDNKSLLPVIEQRLTQMQKERQLNV
jgi:predicted Zn-dependent protease